MNKRIALGLIMAFSVGTYRADAEDTAQLKSKTELQLRAATVNTRQELNLLEENARPQRFVTGQHYVVQLDGPITPERRQKLADAGVRLGNYIPSNAFIVDLDTASPAYLSSLDFVRWVGEYKNEWKLAPEIGNRLEPFKTEHRAAIEAQGHLKMSVTLFPSQDIDRAVADLTLLGADVQVSQTVAKQGVVGLTIHKDLLKTLAAQPYVQFVEESSEITLRNSTNRWIVQSNVLNVTPLYDNGLHGEGQIVGIIDGQIDVNHCSFSDTNPIGPTHRKIEAYNTSLGSNSHGTHVAGTAVGDAGVNNDTRGVAYAGRLVYNTIPSFTETAIVNDLTLHHNQGARIHTNSWGDDGTTAYNGLARGFDAFQYDHEDSLCLLAVTNTSSLKNPENAKNLLAVGASQDTPNQNNHCSGGTGPTADGRRKPEIYAPGCGTNSSTGSGCSTTSMTGTSMASPAVAGTAMLVRQYYMEGFYPSGMADPGDAFTPSAALIKATLLNSAVDMTGVSGYPSNREGWGRVLADNALYFDGDTRSLVMADIWNIDGMSTGQSTTYDVSVVNGVEPLRMTMVFTDPPGASGASNPVVNDLDIEVTAPDGTTVYKGNVFSGGQSITGGTADPRNNVEQVLLNNPPTGNYSIEIIATAINQGAQGYALVITGGVSLGPAPPETEDVAITVPVNSTATAILLVGTDIDEDPLDFIITSLPSHGELSDPNAGIIAAAPYTLTGGGNLADYAPDSEYVGTDGFTYKTNDGNLPPDGGDSNTSNVSILVLADPPSIVTGTLPDGMADNVYGPIQLEVSEGQPPLVWAIGDVPYLETGLGASLYAQVGDIQGWNRDDGFWWYTLPFTFPFYGENYTVIRIWSNGFVDFGAFDGSSYANNDAGLINNRMIAPLWDDLKTTGAGEDIFVDESVPGKVTLRWKGSTYAGNHPVECLLTLYDTGAIRFHYGGGNTPISPTVGISNGDGANYLLSGYNGMGSLADANSVELAEPDLLPLGIGFDTSGLLSGTPSESGTFSPIFTVTDSLGRSDQRTIPLVVSALLSGDFDGDGDVDLVDFTAFSDCLAGPNSAPLPTPPVLEADCIAAFDFDTDGDIDLNDFGAFQVVFNP